MPAIMIAAALAAAGVEVEYVVNNAGFGLFGHAIELDRAEQLGMIAVNIRALTDLSLRFSDQLIRHRGGILNVASIAGFLPGPGMAVYYASKAYVLSFTEAMRRELAPRGVRVTALCPGPVPSEFQERAGFEPGFRFRDPERLRRPMSQRQGYRGLMANKRAVLPGLGIKVAAVAAPAVSARIHPGGGRQIPAQEAQAEAFVPLSGPQFALNQRMNFCDRLAELRMH